MALEAFRRTQIGLESTNGTPVVATKKLFGTTTMTPDTTFHRPVDDRNSLAEFKRAIIVGQQTALRFEGDALYDDIIDFFAMALKGGVTPTTPEGTARLWTFIPNLDSVNAQDAFTWEYGDDSQAWESDFTMVESLELAITLNEVLRLTAEMFARDATKVSFTGLSDRAVQEIVANDLKVWIDGTFANLGTTLKSSLVTGGSIRFPSGLTPVKYADGTLDFSAVSEGRRHMEMDLDLVMGVDAITEYDAYKAGTDRAIRLQFTGPIVSGATSYRLEIDAIGKYMSAPELLGSRDGENIFSLTFASHEDLTATPGNEFSVKVTNKETVL